MDIRVSFNLAKQRLDYYTCSIGISQLSIRQIKSPFDDF